MGLKTFRRRVRLLQSVLSLKCNVCQSKNCTRYALPPPPPPGFHYFQCQDCQLIFVVCDSDFEPAEFYVDTTIPEMGEGEEEWNRHYLESLENQAEEKGKILELGFGNGSFLKMAHESGWETHGVELSEVLVKHASEELGLPNITLGYLEEVGFEDGSFDAVVGFNFLEHVPDPRAILTEFCRLLRPGGLMAVMVPNIFGLYHQLMGELLGDSDPLRISWVPPSHIFYFNKDNLTRLFEEVGLTVVADESARMNCLWRQHELNFGPQVTDQRMETLLQDIKASSTASGAARVAEFKERAKRLVAERMTWSLITDILQLEEPLGAESCLLFVGKKK